MTATFRRYLDRILSSLKNLGTKKKHTKKKPTSPWHHRFRPQMDWLEDRLAPATFHVALSGDDALGDGSAANPYRTLQRAVNETAVANDGNDIILMGSGTYNQAGVDLAVNVPNNANITNLNIRGGWNAGFTTQTGTSTLIPQSAGAGIVIVGGGNLLLQRLAVQQATNVGILAVSATSVTLDQVNLTQNGANGFTSNGVTGFIQITSGNYSNNSAYGITIIGPGSVNVTGASANTNGGSGLYVDLASSVTIDSSTFSGNNLAGIDLREVTNDVSVSNTTASNNNSFDGFFALDVGGNISISNGTFAGNLFGVRALNSNTVSVTNTSVTGNSNTGVFFSTLNSVALSDLTLTGNTSGGTLNLVTTFTYTTTTAPAGIVDDVTVSATQLQHTRNGSAQQAIGLANLTNLIVNTLDGDDTFTLNGNDFDLTVNMGDGDDIVNVLSTNAGNTIQLNGNNNDDTFNFGQPFSGTMDNLLANVTIDGGAGANLVQLNDQSSAVGHTYQVNATTIVRDGAFTLNYTNVDNLAINAGSGNDVFNITPSATTTITIDGGDPFLPTLPGDQLNLNLAGVTNPANLLTGPGAGIFGFGNRMSVGYLSIETINAGAATYDLVLDMNFTIFGNDFDADIIEARLSNDGTQVQLLRNGTGFGYTGILFQGAVSNINSLTYRGSSDDDTFIIQENNGRILGDTGGFGGTANGSHLNASMLNRLNAFGQPTNVGIHFDGNGGTNRIQYRLTTLRNGAYYADTIAASRSGNVNISASGGGNVSSLRMSFANLQPIDWFGAGGTLTIDATGVAVNGDSFTVQDDSNINDGMSQVISSNAAFETNNFTGFDTFQLIAGTGNQIINMLGLDGTATESAVELFGTDTLGTDVGDDVFNVRSTAASYVTTLNGGDGNDTFNVGSAGNSLDTILGAVTINGDAGGGDVVNINDQNDVDANLYTITGTTVSRSGAALITYGTVESLIVNAGLADDTINVQSTIAATPVTVNGGSGDDTFNIGNAGTLANILGTVLLNGNGHVAGDVVNFNDQSDAGGNIYTLTNNTLTRSGAAGISFINVEQVTLNASLGNDTINVTSSFATVTTAVNAGGGDDVINVGNAGTLSGLLGPLFLNGNGGANDVININDQADAGPQTYTITSTTVARSGSGLMTYGTVESLVLNASLGSDTINVQSTLATTPVTVNAGGGDDVINVGNAGTLSGILGALTVNGNAGAADVINFNDQNDAGPRIYTLTNNTLTRSGAAGMSFVTVEQVVLNASLGSDTINVTSSFATVATTVNAGGGDDIINLGSAGSLDLLLGNLVVDGGTGTNTLNVNDQTDASGNTYDLNATTLTRNGGFTTTYANIASLNINAGTGSDTFNVTGSAGTTFFIDGNTPTAPVLPGDVLNFNLAGVTNGRLDLNGPNLGSFSGTGILPLNYSNIESINGVGGDFELFVNLFATVAGSFNGAAGFDGVADTTIAQLDATGTQFQLLFNGVNAFAGNVSAIRALSVLGSLDADTFRIQEVNGRLITQGGGFGGSATGSGAHMNGKAAGFLTGQGQPTNVQVHFDGGNGAAIDRMQFAFTTSRNARFFADGVAASRSGVVNVSGTGNVPVSALRSSFSNLTPIDFFGAGGTLTVDNSALSGADTLTVQDDGVAANGVSQVVSSNPAFETTNFTGFNALEVLGGDGNQTLIMAGLDTAATETSVTLFGTDTTNTDAGNDTLIVQASAAGVVTILNGGLGNDTFRIGNAANQVGTVLGAVFVNGEGGTDSLLYDDSGNAVGSTYTLTSTTISRTGVGLVTYGTVESLTLNASQGADVINVQSTFATTPALVNANGGADTINVSSDAPVNSGNLDGIEGGLTIDGGTGVNVLNISDFSSTTANANAIIGNSTITGLAGPTDATTINYLATGGTFGAINVSGSNTSADVFTIQNPNGPLNLFTFGGNDTVNLQSNSFAVLINTGLGDDTINIASDAPTNLGNLNSIGATVTVDGDGGSNVLNVSDFSSTTANANVFITFNQILNFAGAADNQTINYTATGGTFSAINITGSNTSGDVFTIQNPNGPLNLNSQGGADTINVQSISFVATINTGAGNDIINVSSDAPTNLGTLNFIAATLNLDAGAGTNSLIVSDFAAVAGNTNVIVTNTQILNFAGAADNQIINYAATGGSFSNLTLIGSNTLSETFTIQNPNGILTLNMNGGDDTANVQSLSLAATINGNGGNDVFNVSSDAPANLGNLNGINGTLTLNAGTGANRLHVSDFGNATGNPNVVLFNNAITGIAGATNTTSILYSLTPGVGNTLDLIIDGSDTAVDTIYINGTLAGSNNTINGNGGNDTLVVRVSAANSPGPVRLNGGAGDDEFAFANQAALFDGFVDGGSGVNQMNYYPWTTTVRVDLTLGYATGLNANGVPLQPNRIAPGTIQNLIGGSAADLLIGDAQNNRIEGRGGNNYLVGQAGNDILIGGPGSDILVGGTGNDMLFGGGGRDWYFGDFIRPGTVPVLPGVVNVGLPGFNVIILNNCNEVRQGPTGAFILDLGGGPGVRGRFVLVQRAANGVIIGPVFVEVGPVVLGPFVPFLVPRYLGG